MDPQKRPLTNMASLLDRPHSIHGQAQDTLIMRPNEGGRLLVAPLRRKAEQGFVDWLARSTRHGHGHRFPHRHNPVDRRETNAVGEKTN
jgi:hypothetical protein